MGHYRQYGGLPSLEALAQNGHRLLPATDAVNYYLERARNRAVGNVLQANHPEFVRATGQGNANAAITSLRTMLASSSAYLPDGDIVSLVDAVAMVREDYAMA